MHPHRDDFYLKKLLRISFRSVPKLGMDYSETHKIRRREHFFPQNNESNSESISRKKISNGILMATLVQLSLGGLL